MRKKLGLFCFCVGSFFNLNSQNDSLKRWNVGFELNYTQIFFKNKAPYYSNVFSSNTGGAFMLSRSIFKAGKKRINLYIGFSYLQYCLQIPDLNYFYTSFPPDTATVKIIDMLGRKRVDFRYFNVPFSYSFQFRVKNKLGFGIGGGLNSFFMIKPFIVNESYSFYTNFPTKTNVPNNGYQVNEIVYYQNSLAPYSEMEVNYNKNKKNKIAFKFACCLLYQAQKIVDKGGSAEYYSFNGLYGNSVRLYTLPFRGTRLSLSYRYTF